MSTDETGVYETLSFLVAHMEKFKKEAVRGIQGHNQRERKSKSNPDIDYDRVGLNYDLHNSGPVNYGKLIDQRIDSLNLKKVPRSDAVYMCEVVVSSDAEFFKGLSQSEQRRFFLAAKEWLDDFAGRKNVIAAIVHLDEKTPHLHYSHVPVTKDGRLCAKDVYTKESLRELQNGLPRYLQSRGFDIDRGVEQGPGSSKKHLNTREFKQQKEAEKNLKLQVENVEREVQSMTSKLANQKAELRELEQAAREAEASLSEKPDLPKPGFIISKSDYAKALEIIAIQNQALADKKLIMARAERLEKERQNIDRLIATAVEESETKAAIKYDTLKKESAQIQKELETQVAKLRQEIQRRESSHKQLMESMRQHHQEFERLKAVEKKWQAAQQAKEIEARKAEMAAKARQQSVRKAPMLEPLPPQAATAQRDQKNLSPGR